MVGHHPDVVAARKGEIALRLFFARGVGKGNKTVKTARKGVGIFFRKFVKTQKIIALYIPEFAAGRLCQKVGFGKYFPDEPVGCHVCRKQSEMRKGMQKTGGFRVCFCGGDEIFVKRRLSVGGSYFGNFVLGKGKNVGKKGGDKRKVVVRVVGRFEKRDNGVDLNCVENGRSFVGNNGNSRVFKRFFMNSHKFSGRDEYCKIAEIHGALLPDGLIENFIVRTYYFFYFRRAELRLFFVFRFSARPVDEKYLDIPLVFFLAESREPVFFGIGVTVEFFRKNARADKIRKIEYRLFAAEVFRKTKTPQFLCFANKIFRFGIAEFINALFHVPDDEQFSAAVGNRSKEKILHIVRILIFVDNDFEIFLRHLFRKVGRNEFARFVVIIGNDERQRETGDDGDGITPRFFVSFKIFFVVFLKYAEKTQHARLEFFKVFCGVGRSYSENFVFSEVLFEIRPVSFEYLFFLRFFKA